MVVVPFLLGLLLLPATHAGTKASPSPSTPSSPSPTPEAPRGPVILFLVDNSASLPPLDPDEKRVAALEKMFGFLQGQPYRLVLFGGRHEIYVDEVIHYNNKGLWTDFYFALDKARELMSSYPPGTEFRMILLTDAILDPGPEDWADMGVGGEDLKAHVTRRIVELLQQLKVPLYVILVGDLPKEGVAPGGPEQAPPVVLEMVRAANGARASPTAQSLASFFNDDGVLLKKFVFRVAPTEGLKRIEPVIRRIVAPARPLVELGFLSALVLPLTLFVLLLLGILVRSFPGPGDAEVVELALDDPVHLAADRLHRVEAGGWGTAGLSLVGETRDAAATVRYQKPALDLQGTGLDLSGADALTAALVPMNLEAMGQALDAYTRDGSKEEKIYALNLEYIARNFNAAQAERLLGIPLAERARVSPLDFLRAKAHLLGNPELRRRLTEPRVNFVSYGAGGERKELVPGTPLRLGPYRFVVKDVEKGGRKDVRLVLAYDRVPSALKTLLPERLQRAVRFRAAAHRLVS